MKPFEASLDEFMAYVSRAQALPVKEDFICSLCSGKTVLDIGCVNHSFETALSLGDKWLHKRLKGVSKSLVGIDILESDAKKLNALGYNILVRNAENFELGKTFDVVNCGDIIEHVSNVGLFFSSIEKHMD